MRLKENIGLAKVSKEDQGVVNQTYASAIRDIEKAEKKKAEFTKRQAEPKHDEKPKNPKMVSGAKKMHLDESLFEGLLVETGEWEDDEKGLLWRQQLLDLMHRYTTFDNLELEDVKGFDKYQGPYVYDSGLEFWLDNENEDCLLMHDIDYSVNAPAWYRICSRKDFDKFKQGNLEPLSENLKEDVLHTYPKNTRRQVKLNGIKETRVGKTKEVRVLQGNYGYGWDDLIEYDIADFNGDLLAMNREIKQDLRDYRENERNADHRVVTRRVARELKEDKELDKEVSAIRRDMTKVGMTPKKSREEHKKFLSKLKDKRKEIKESALGNQLSLTESKQLNEGAGAGYTVQGELYEIKINHIEDIEVHQGKSAFGTDLEFAKVKVDADAKFDGAVESYYYGADLEGAQVKITEFDINPNILHYLGLEEFNYGEITAEDLQSQFGSTLKFKSDVIGWGWVHTPFDGNVTASRVNDDYSPFVDGVSFHFVNQADIDYAEQGLQGELDDDYIDYDYADDMEDGYWEDKFNESVNRELVDEFAYEYGLSKAEAKKRLKNLSKEEQEKKLKLLKQGRSKNAKVDFYESINGTCMVGHSLKEMSRYDMQTQFDNRKSFYNKADVDVDDETGEKTLYSYNTPVAKITKDKKVTLLPKWDLSATTLRHVKEFLKQNGLAADSLKQIRRDYI